MMKYWLPVFAALMLAGAATPILAQTPKEQQACEGDVYSLCGEAIPDQNRIVACLRKHWSKVSRECRHVMANYGKGHREEHRSRRRDAEK